MFSKSDKKSNGAGAKPAGDAATRKPNATVSIISSDLKVLGDLESTGDIVIEGIVEGDVHSNGLTIGQAAHVKGSVFAQQVTIAGTITGRVQATNVTIKTSARVTGDVAHETLSIEAGAHLEGRFSREGFAKTEETAKVETVKPIKAAAGNGMATGNAQASGGPVPASAAR